MLSSGAQSKHQVSEDAPHLRSETSSSFRSGVAHKTCPPFPPSPPTQQQALPAKDGCSSVEIQLIAQWPRPRIPQDTQKLELNQVTRETSLAVFLPWQITQHSRGARNSLMPMSVLAAHLGTHHHFDHTQAPPRICSARTHKLANAVNAFSRTTLTHVVFKLTRLRQK